jgi:serine/threonine protein phosphatase PrpC
MKQLDFFSASEAGADHERNEDFVVMDSGLGAFVIADGMGGRPGGALASQLAVEVFLDRLRQADRPALLDETYLRDALSEANSKVHELEEGDELKAGMGTTITAVVMNGTKGKIVHVGDSRAYLFNDSGLVQITEDHTLVSELLKRNILTEADAEHYPFRHVLSKAVGPQETVEPDTYDFEMTTGDWLLLSTDGLTKALNEIELLQLMRQHRTKNAKSLGRAIMQAAVQRKAPDDDVTIALIRVVERGLDEGV